LFVVLPDYHIHTTLSKHASGEPSEYRATAVRRGVPEMCFSDHTPNYNGLGRDCTMEPEDYPIYRSMIAKLQDDRVPRVLFGIEADFIPGCEKPLAQWLDDKALDLVIGSVHFIDDWAFDHPAQCDKWKNTDVAGVWKAYFAILSQSVESGLFDIVGHLDLPKKFGYRPPDRLLREMCKPALDSIAKSGLAIEINTAGLRKPAKEIYPSPIILELARERGIPICVGSDSHAPAAVGMDFGKALLLARQTGYRTFSRFHKRQAAVTELPGQSERCD